MLTRSLFVFQHDSLPAACPADERPGHDQRQCGRFCHKRGLLDVLLPVHSTAEQGRFLEAAGNGRSTDGGHDWLRADRKPRGGGGSLWNDHHGADVDADWATVVWIGEIVAWGVFGWTSGITWSLHFSRKSSARRAPKVYRLP